MSDNRKIIIISAPSGVCPELRERLIDRLEKEKYEVHIWEGTNKAQLEGRFFDEESLAYMKEFGEELSCNAKERFKQLHMCEPPHITRPSFYHRDRASWQANSRRHSYVR